MWRRCVAGACRLKSPVENNACFPLSTKVARRRPRSLFKCKKSGTCASKGAENIDKNIPGPSKFQILKWFDQFKEPMKRASKVCGDAQDLKLPG